jgi:MscS family membrane protein
MQETLEQVLSIPAVRATATIVASIIAAFVVERTLHRALLALAGRTETDLDDVIVSVLRRPIFLTAIFIGLYLATGQLRSHLPDRVRWATTAVIITLGIFLWAGAAIRIGTVLLGAFSRTSREGSVVRPSNLPMFEILFKVGVVVAAIYFVFLTWHIDLTAWLASAGIIGIAIGFGAKDTLANLFAGIFIVADAPYKVGDFIVLDDGVRGKVTSIGIRSTRLLTTDDIEVTIPNGIIGNSRIVNEAGGPDIVHRIRVNVSVAYGSDIDRVREVLIGCADGVEMVCDQPRPQVRFREFGGSGLEFALHAWVREPALRDAALDVLHCRVYKAFAAEGIEIPYSKHDLYIKELPQSS